jgi:UDP-N-acetylmuramoyl-L-alanyl-D-glutamate--2,6-diaminopimelate ligase
MMGAVADRWADEIVLTNDNPRGESPDQIITDIEAGIESHEALRQPDRAKAIYQAINNADEDDIVLIAGKGHEQSQVIGNALFPFCDREVVTNLLRGNA